MSMFGLFSGDKKTQQTTTNTSTQQTDSSKNLGTGAMLLESGATYNDLSEAVARDALAGISSVANNSVSAVATVADNATSRAFDLGEETVRRIATANANTISAAQESVSYANRLAEIGLSAKSSADTGGAVATIESAGKYIVAAAAIVAAFWFMKGQSK